MSSKFVVAQTSGLYEFGPAYQKVYEADGPTAAAIAHHISVVEEARCKHEAQVQRYEESKPSTPKPPVSKGSKKPAPRPTKKSHIRDPGPFVEPKPMAVIVLDVDRNEWHTVSVQPPPPPPYEEWVWTVKEYTDAEDLDEDDDNEF